MCTEYRSRRDVLRLAALLTAAGAAPLLSTFNAQAQPGSDEPVRIGYLPITDAAPLLIAHHNGYFEAAGLKSETPRLFRSWSQLAEAFISGQTNVVHLLSPMTIWARFNSQIPAKIVAWNHINGSAVTVAPDINDWADLGGKRIAIPFWYSIHNVVLQALLRKQGLTVKTQMSDSLGPRDVLLVVMSPSDMLPALATGSISAYIVAEPFNAAAELMGVGKILRFTGDAWQDHACCTVFMHERDLNNRPAWSQAVVDGIVKAQQWIDGHRTQTAEILSRDSGNRYTPHSRPILNKVLSPEAGDREHYLASGAITHTDWDEPRIGFQPYPYPSYTEALITELRLTEMAADSAFLHTLQPKQAAAELVDDRFVKQAINQLGGPAVFGQPLNWQREEVIEP